MKKKSARRKRISGPLTVQQLIHKADIVKIIGQHVKLQRTSKSLFMGRCPFHQEAKRSSSRPFSVHTEKQVFHCFTCAASGDVLTFIAKVERISRLAATRLLAEQFSVVFKETPVEQQFSAKADLLARYATRQPKQFMQIDVHDVGVDSMDSVLKPDRNGLSLTWGNTTELMSGPVHGVRLLVDTNMSQEKLRLALCTVLGDLDAVLKSRATVDDDIPF